VEVEAEEAVEAEVEEVEEVEEVVVVVEGHLQVEPHPSTESWEEIHQPNSMETKRKVNLFCLHLHSTEE